MKYICYLLIFTVLNGFIVISFTILIRNVGLWLLSKQRTQNTAGRYLKQLLFAHSANKWYLFHICYYGMLLHLEILDGIWHVNFTNLVCNELINFHHRHPRACEISCILLQLQVKDIDFLGDSVNLRYMSNDRSLFNFHFCLKYQSIVSL